MALKAEALRAAQASFLDALRSEAEGQRAYVAELSDGSISLELEGVDFKAMLQGAIAAYLAGMIVSSTSRPLAAPADAVVPPQSFSSSGSSEPAHVQAGVPDDTNLLRRCIREMGMRRRALSLLAVGSALVA